MSGDSEQGKRHEPESLRLSAIAPSLTVNDVQKSMEFYSDVVGFTVFELWKHDGKVRGADLIAGTSHLMIGQDDFKKGKDRQKGVGFRLYLTTTQSVDELAAAMKARGAKLDSEPEDMEWGARAFSFRDPDGFAITIAAEQTGGTE
jgi:uncharacterized glyoxalase superfamily protein PhnB